MPNNNAFCSDYSYVTNCLLAIQTAANNGEYDNYPEVTDSINSLDKDTLRKLYLRVIAILGILNGEEGFPQVHITGDYSELDFAELDFWVGFSNANISGDFFEQNFFELDFWTGYMDNGYDDYVAIFQTILNIFKEFCSRSNELSDYEKALVDASLLAFLDAFNALKALLEQLDINPCESSGLNIFNNSPGVFLQVAGADGSNGIAEGFHLRWNFTGELANNHLPKGDYFNSNNNNGFNQPNDFVQIYRTPYQNAAIVEIDLQQTRPVVNSQQRYWTYSINQVVNDTAISNQVRIYFTDSAKYYSLASTINPNNNSFDFLNAYNDVIEISVFNKTFFHFDLRFSRQTSATPSYAKIEAICFAGGPEERIKQTIVINDQTALASIVGDNLSVLRYKKSLDVILDKISFETYHDFQLSRSLTNWSVVGAGFAISLNEAEVRDRLESTAYPIDNLWPQYNDGTRVRASNYIDKWFSDSVEVTDQSIQQLVALYLQKSETDPRAFYNIYAEDDIAEENPQKISLLDVIQMQALDYHIARMLGLGHIDTPSNVDVQQRFVYKLVYENKKSMASPVRTTYTYLGLPTSKQDTLLPSTPQMRPVSYQMSTEEDLSFMFDEQGYSKRENTRVVNIGRQLFFNERKDFNFFASLDEAVNENFFRQPKPVYYGIEYRMQSASSYVKPEITATDNEVMGKVYYAYDDDFPVAGIPELNPLPDDAISLFVHFERGVGIHCYALYGINWFSRASSLSNEVATDETIFQSANLLFAPTDLSVQYVQKEDELVFTTNQEQTWLRKRIDQFPNQDTAFTRITFNWVDMIDVSGLTEINEQTLAAIIRSNKTKVFFKPGLQREVIGVIADMRPVTENDSQLILFTGAYQLITEEEKEPFIANEDLDRFVGGVLSTPEGQFKVLEVNNGSNGLPYITIEKLFVRDRTDDRQSELLFGSYKNYTIPAMGSRFSMVENLSNEGNWEPLAEKIELISFADVVDPVIEVDAGESADTKYWMGGINGAALITPIPNEDDVFDGYYEISFDTVSLSPHPQVNIPFEDTNPTKNAPGQLHQAHVEWYKGMVRLPIVDSDERKLLQVVMLQESSPIKLYVYDASFDTSLIKSSTDENDLISVNYHPGYRAYFFAEPAPLHSFNEGNIMPPPDDNDKRSLIAVQTYNELHASYASAISLPSVLLARNIYEPQQLDEPVAPGLKVRPDPTKQAAFTFDVRVPSSRKPFGFMFYRISHVNVLSVLYAPETIIGITAQLEALTSDPNFNQRYLDLVNLKFEDEENLVFEVYEAEPISYGFPTPDRPGLFLPEDNTQQKMAKLEAAILATLLPLTEQPPILNYLKQGLQTTNDLPVIRDANGDLLDPTDTRFNPFPMVRTYVKPDDVGAKYVRITDYFLNAFSRDLYFYTCAEINNQLNIGPISKFLGPVEILYTETAAVPIIDNYALRTSFSAIDSPTVTFEIASLPAIEQFEKLRLFRTNNKTLATSIAQMEQVLDVEIDPETIASSIFEDDFSDLPLPPFGHTLYYRIVAVRTIINEFEEAEEVLSQPSTVASVQLVDTQSPDAPELSYDEPTNTLSWMPATYDGTYYLFKQNSRANWERIYSIQPPDSNQPMSYELPEPLPTVDDDGNSIYHRFKIQVENSSGRMNILDNELTV
ncbi:hypothetical protein [Pedobacter sp. UBA4863]|uniref:hypothetical protein n=1 Tax=Pedobacter sp. UBA4863 TaxID=1947060 RepID=UPI0025D10FBD|nr:hypothetical protein [Pedobacter sp. UBA4863]